MLESLELLTFNQVTHQMCSPSMTFVITIHTNANLGNGEHITTCVMFYNMNYAMQLQLQAAGNINNDKIVHLMLTNEIAGDREELRGAILCDVVANKDMEMESLLFTSIVFLHFYYVLLAISFP